MKNYILFVFIFIFYTAAYSQTGGGLRRGGGKSTGVQSMGAEGKRSGQRPAEGVKGKARKQGGDCNTGGQARGTGVDGATRTGIRPRTGTRTGTGTRISQPNIRANKGVRNF